MSVSAPAFRGSLSERIKHLSDRVEYRFLVSAEDRMEAFRLRYDAYYREELIAYRPDGLFLDDIDEQSNCFLFGVYIDGILASSIRLSISLPDAPDLPTGKVFPEIVPLLVEAGRRVIDPTRFVADHNMSRMFPELPFVTLRLPWMAMEHFAADIMLAAVRPEHQNFYIRLWGNAVLCEARPYPNLIKPVALTALDFEKVRDDVERRHPYFHSTQTERYGIFSRGTEKVRASTAVQTQVTLPPMQQMIS